MKPSILFILVLISISLFGEEMKTNKCPKPSEYEKNGVCTNVCDQDPEFSFYKKPKIDKNDPMYFGAAVFVKYFVNEKANPGVFNCYGIFAKQKPYPNALMY